MGIRLLQKSEIAKAKAQDRQQELIEGKKLASKVDTLRELRAEEEASLDKFRIETLKTIQIELDYKFSEKKQLEDQIKERKEELDRVLGPLDKQLMHYIADKKAEIDSKTAEIEQKNTILGEKIAQTDALLEENKQENTKLIVLQVDARQIKAQAKDLLDRSKQEAQDLLSDAQKIFEKADVRDSESKRMNADAKARKAQQDFKETDLTRKEEELEVREMNALAAELLYYSPVKKH